jgi:hypothetical protein
MENLDKVFEQFVKDQVITEETKKELSVVFESMVNEAVKAKLVEEKKAIVADYDSKFEIVVAEHNENTKDMLNSYLKHCVEEFVTENKVAIKNAIVVEKSKQIIDGIQAVFEKHGIRLPEGNESIVSEMNQKNENLMKENTKVVNENIQLKAALEEAEKAVAFIKMTAEMSEVSKEKLMNLMSGLVTESVEDFKEKLSILKKTVATEAKKKKKVTKEEDEEEKKKDEEMTDEEDDVEDDVEDKVEEEEDEEDEEKKKEDEVAKEERSKVDSYLSRLRR